jgi:RimJ/RimL family protein N-acetyltransferase
MNETNISAVFETKRMFVRRARTRQEDVDLFFRLWNDPLVMCNVGFPEGLLISRDEVEQILSDNDPGLLDSKLLAVLKQEGVLIGECKLGRPDAKKIAETDIKLLPEFHNRGLGRELKQGLVDYLFTHTDCMAVRSTPNVNNTASQKMQEYVGAKKTGRQVYHFPEKMKIPTEPVDHFIYFLDRQTWEKRSQNNPK